MWRRMECAKIPKDKELVTYQTGVQNAAQFVQGPGWIPMATDKSWDEISCTYTDNSFILSLSYSTDKYTNTLAFKNYFN